MISNYYLFNRMNGEISSFYISDSMTDLLQIQAEDDKNNNRWVRFDDEFILEPLKAQKYY